MLLPFGLAVFGLPLLSVWDWDLLDKLPPCIVCALSALTPPTANTGYHTLWRHLSTPAILVSSLHIIPVGPCITIQGRSISRSHWDFNSMFAVCHPKLEGSGLAFQRQELMTVLLSINSTVSDNLIKADIWALQDRIELSLTLKVYHCMYIGRWYNHIMYMNL